MKPFFGQVAAIVEAQFRSLFHFYSRGGKVGAAIAGILTAGWYAMIAIGAVAAGFYCSRAASGPALSRSLAAGLLFIVVYWQFIPLMLVSTGAGLDLKRLVVYPVSRQQLFALDLALRVTSGVEPLLLLTGGAIGLWFNPRLAWWAPLAFAPFVAFNLCMASGLRAVFGRLLAGRRTREVAMLGLALLAAVPQLLMATGFLERLGIGRGWTGLTGSPWAATANWASGRLGVLDLAASFLWVAVAAAFGLWQFRRTLRFDQTAASASSAHRTAARWSDPLFRWPVALLGDPLGALVEKELRSLSRTPRFRIVFIMGFSFSLLIWLPLLATRGGMRSTPPESFLALMLGYALLLLGESCFWNVLGFDRAAAQFYFLAPTPFAAVMKAKNIATAIVVALELAGITAVALALRLPVTPAKVAEAAAAGAVFTLLLLAGGNLGSVYMPRAADPSDVWRKASAGKTQALVVFVSPLLAAPVLLAYLARYAFEAEWAFWPVMAVVAGIAAVVYWLAMESAVSAAMQRREQITTVLSRGGGPIAT